MQLSIRLVIYPVHMANKTSLGPILVHDARGKLAVRRTGMNTFVSVVLGTGIALARVAGFPTSGFPKHSERRRRADLRLGLRCLQLVRLFPT